MNVDPLSAVKLRARIRQLQRRLQRMEQLVQDIADVVDNASVGEDPCACDTVSVSSDDVEVVESSIPETPVASSTPPVPPVLRPKAWRLFRPIPFPLDGGVACADASVRGDSPVF